MKNLLKHLKAQPFVVATGIAALVHSTWSIATYFSGPEPDGGFSWRWAGWAAVAFLIAFSMDVGQIVTSAEIREGKRSWTKYLTFFVFAAATYYAQFLYISSHMPVVPLAAGVRPELAGAIQWARDLSVFILPGLLPASTLLYTFSHEKPTGSKGDPVVSVTPGRDETPDWMKDDYQPSNPTAEEYERWRQMFGPESEGAPVIDRPLPPAPDQSSLSPNGHGESVDVTA